jgi:arylformamidase
MTTAYLDISVPIAPDMLVWPTDPQPEVQRVQHKGPKADINVTALRLGSHTGTHVDAPLHFSVGETTVDRIPLSTLIGPAQVCDLRGVTGIGRSDLAAAGAGEEKRVLLRTDNSQWIRTGPAPDSPAHLTEDGAHYLAARGVVLVGLDGLSVDAPGSYSAHLSLLGAGVVLLETIDLSAAVPGRYELLCLPLRLAGGDGAPARTGLRSLYKAAGRPLSGLPEHRSEECVRSSYGRLAT